MYGEKIPPKTSSEAKEAGRAQKGQLVKDLSTPPAGLPTAPGRTGAVQMQHRGGAGLALGTVSLGKLLSLPTS